MRFGEVRDLPAGKQLIVEHTVEIEGQDKPACVAAARGAAACQLIRSSTIGPGVTTTPSPDVVAALERGERAVEALRLVGEQREERLALGDLVARAGVPDDAGAGLHRVLLAGPAGAEAPRGEPDGHRVEPGEDAAGGRGDHVRLPGLGQRRVGVAALGADHRLPGVHRRAVGELVGRVDVVATGAGEHLAGQREGQLDDVGRTAAGEHLDRLGDLDRVAGGEAERGGHVGEQRDGVHAGVGAERDHRLGELAGRGRGPS